MRPCEKIALLSATCAVFFGAAANADWETVTEQDSTRFERLVGELIGSTRGETLLTYHDDSQNAATLIWHTPVESLCPLDSIRITYDWNETVTEPAREASPRSNKLIIQNAETVRQRLARDGSALMTFLDACGRSSTSLFEVKNAE